MATDKLTQSRRISPGSNALANNSLGSSERTAMLALDLTTSLMKVELTDAETLYWKGMLALYTAPAIEWAFREYLKTAIFFPKPAEIIELLDNWNREERARLADAAKREEKVETEKRRAKGETFGLADVYTQFHKLLDGKAVPEIPAARKKIQEQAATLRRRVVRKAAK